MNKTYVDFVKTIVGVIVILMAVFYAVWSICTILASHMYYEAIMGIIGSVAIIELSFKTLMTPLVKVLQNEEES